MKKEIAGVKCSWRKSSFLPQFSVSTIPSGPWIGQVQHPGFIACSSKCTVKYMVSTKVLFGYVFSCKAVANPQVEVWGKDHLQTSLTHRSPRPLNVSPTSVYSSGSIFASSKPR